MPFSTKERHLLPAYRKTLQLSNLSYLFLGDIPDRRSTGKMPVPPEKQVN
ncbi:MAG: hypothetical protein KME17_19865 [Cyanosarcina radialis HA8281-LM2]|nr:hypothetical protein [Cyanosarcina radialis HA8281-LM2]